MIGWEGVGLVELLLLLVVVFLFLVSGFGHLGLEVGAG